jgi:hypothetical protein
MVIAFAPRYAFAKWMGGIATNSRRFLTIPFIADDNRQLSCVCAMRRKGGTGNHALAVGLSDRQLCARSGPWSMSALRQAERPRPTVSHRAVARAAINGTSVN